MYRLLTLPGKSRHYRLPTRDAPLVAKRFSTMQFSLSDPEYADAYGVDPFLEIALVGQPGFLALVFPFVCEASVSEESFDRQFSVRFAQEGGLLAIQDVSKSCFAPSHFIFQLRPV